MRPDLAVPHAGIDPAALLCGATRLAGSACDAELRLAGSAAFRAVFHALVGHAVRHLMPNAHRADRLRMAGAFDPASVAEVCRWLTGLDGPRHAAPLLGPLLRNDRVTEVAAAYLPLLQVCHQADYDHLATFTAPGIAADVELARATVADLAQLGGSRDGHVLFLLVAAQRALH